MKQVFVTLALVAASVFSVQAQDKKGGAEFKFKGGETHDFGTLKEGPVATHVFEFTNVGNEPLIIQNASASCGCTTPEWPKEPILPGKKGKIVVNYNTQGRVAPFTKDVYIQSNAKMADGKERYELHIKGTVVAAEDPAKGAAAKPADVKAKN
jgi:hypothetical protein